MNNIACVVRFETFSLSHQGHGFCTIVALVILDPTTSVHEDELADLGDAYRLQSDHTTRLRTFSLLFLVLGLSHVDLVDRPSDFSLRQCYKRSFQLLGGAALLIVSDAGFWHHFQRIRDKERHRDLSCPSSMFSLPVSYHPFIIFHSTLLRHESSWHSNLLLVMWTPLNTIT